MNSKTGGFVGSNAGSISDCYSLLEFHNSNKTGVSGFSGVNAGVIRQCFCSSSLDHKREGFGTGEHLINCFFFTDSGDAKKAEKLPDHDLWRERPSSGNSRDAHKWGFAPDKWIFTGDQQVLAFNEDNWFYKPEMVSFSTQSNSFSGTAGYKIRIDSVNALVQFAQSVNDGDAAARNADVTLVENLDLGGRSWIPIGKDASHSFRGRFNGNGHRISNFRIDEKLLSHRGFFGILEGSAFNLSIDCTVKGGGVVGSMAGLLLGGSILCCGAVITLLPDQKAEAVGGLVGISTGDICLSYAAGRAKFVPFLLHPLPLTILLSLMTAAILATAVVINLQDRPDSFSTESAIPSVPADPGPPEDQENGQPSIPEPDLPDLPSYGESELHRVSFSCSKNLYAALSSGKVSLDYRGTDPSEDQKVVLQLRLSTGVIIAEGGPFLPGTEVTELPLTAEACRDLSPGRYSAELLILPYSISSDMKSITEIVFPVVLAAE